MGVCIVCGAETDKSNSEEVEGVTFIGTPPSIHKKCKARSFVWGTGG